MNRVVTLALFSAALCVVSVSYAKPTPAAPGTASSAANAKATQGADVYFKATSAGAQGTAYTDKAQATLTCANKYTLVWASAGKAYCRKVTTEVRSVALVCPANTTLVTEDKVPSSARSFQYNDLCYKNGSPVDSRGSYTFPLCETDSTGGYKVTAGPGPDKCEKTLYSFNAISPGTPDPRENQTGATEARIAQAVVKCPENSSAVSDETSIVCKKN